MYYLQPMSMQFTDYFTDGDALIDRALHDLAMQILAGFKPNICVMNPYNLTQKSIDIIKESELRLYGCPIHVDSGTLDIRFIYEDVYPSIELEIQFE